MRYPDSRIFFRLAVVFTSQPQSMNTPNSPQKKDSSSQDAEESGCGTLIVLCLILLFGGSLAGGGYFVYQGVSRYMDGTPITSSKVAVPLLGAVIFFGVLLSFASRMWSSEEASEIPDEAPWTVRPAWQTREISELEPTLHQILFAVIWNLFSFPFAGVVLYSVVWPLSDPGWKMVLFTIFILVFPVIGLWQAWKVLKKKLQHWRFGHSTLVMDPMPARLGGRLQARLRIPTTRDDLSEEGVSVQLTCYRRELGGEGKIRRVEQWSSETQIHRSSVSRRETSVEVPISIDLPSDESPSSPRKHASRTQWELVARGSRPGLDYVATFEVPVFEAEADPSQTT